MPRRAGLCAAEIVFRNVVLQRTQEHVGNAVGDRDELQRPIARSLPCQRRPALIGAEDAADGGRRDLARLQPMCRIERVVAAPISGEDAFVNLLVAGIDPALDGAGVHVRREAERLVAGLPAAHAVGIGALLVGIEHAFVCPQAVEERARLGELWVLAGHHLRLRPVDVEDLRLAGLERGEIFVEASLLDLALLVVVGLEIRAKLGEPVARDRRREDSAHDRTTGSADRLTRRLRNRAAPDVAVVDFGDDGPSGSHVLADRVGGAAHVIFHLVKGTPERLAARRHRALESDDLVCHVKCGFALLRACCPPSSCSARML